MLFTSDPERQLQARVDARAMIEFAASNCFRNMNEDLVEDKMLLLDFLYASYKLTGDKEVN
ncbi:hypothetical protein Mapa_009964 [Marchantia paleacea]|nr:hypothetical protein Mapa_009964 [Marchantia paleacea]